jgi:hypothetical protein
MKTSKKKTSKAKARNKRSAAETKTKPAVKQSKPTAKPMATGVRSEASRRTAEGKFTKVIFNQVGGKECPRFAAMTWTERDAFMAQPENAAVRDRYEKHMASVGVK